MAAEVGFHPQRTFSYYSASVCEKFLYTNVCSLIGCQMCIHIFGSLMCIPTHGRQMCIHTFSIFGE